MNKQTCQILLYEHARQPITGNVLTVGRQTVWAGIDEIKQLYSNLNINYDESLLELDNSTKSGKGKNKVADYSFFKALGVNTVDAIDVSSYEDANIIADLTDAVPQELMFKYDFVYNGSCLDNIFSPADAIRNMTYLLNETGRIFHIEHSTHYMGPYIKLSPDWFYDFYVYNNFDVAIYIAIMPKTLNDEWDIYEWIPALIQRTELPFDRLQTENFLTICIAQKRKNSNIRLIFPIQKKYRQIAIKFTSNNIHWDFKHCKTSNFENNDNYIYRGSF